MQRLLKFLSVPLAAVAALLLSACETTAPGASSDTTAPAVKAPSSGLHEITTVQGTRYFDVEPLKPGMSVSWDGGKDAGGMCHGKGEEYHFSTTGGQRRLDYMWVGTYEHGKANGDSVILNPEAGTSQAVSYEMGKVVFSADPSPLSQSKLNTLRNLEKEMTGYTRQTVAPARDERWWIGLWHNKKAPEWYFEFKADGTWRSEIDGGEKEEGRWTTKDNIVQCWKKVSKTLAQAMDIDVGDEPYVPGKEEIAYTWTLRDDNTADGRRPYGSFNPFVKAQ